MANQRAEGFSYWRFCLWAAGLSAAFWFALGMASLLLEIGGGDFWWRVGSSEVVAFAAASAMFVGLSARRAAIRRGDAVGSWGAGISGVIVAASFGAVTVDLWIDWGAADWLMTRLELTGLGAGALGFHCSAIGLIGIGDARTWLVAVGARIAGACTFGAAMIALWSAAGPLPESFGLVVVGLVLGYGVTAAFCSVYVFMVTAQPVRHEDEISMAFPTYILWALTWIAMWLFVLMCTMEVGMERFAIGSGAVCVTLTVGVWMLRRLEIGRVELAERRRRREARWR